MDEYCTPPIRARGFSRVELRLHRGGGLSADITATLQESPDLSLWRNAAALRLPPLRTECTQAIDIDDEWVRLRVSAGGTPAHETCRVAAELVLGPNRPAPRERKEE